jgi:hypothetical protein
MANGHKGDHPITDIFVHGLETYGKEADDLIRKIGELAPLEVHSWWDAEIGWKGDSELALQKAKARYAELSQRAARNNSDPTP